MKLQSHQEIVVLIHAMALRGWPSGANLADENPEATTQFQCLRSLAAWLDSLQVAAAATVAIPSQYLSWEAGFLEAICGRVIAVSTHVPFLFVKGPRWLVLACRV